MSLKYWKSFLWNTVQHFLHTTNAVLHYHIRIGTVKEENKGKKTAGKIAFHLNVPKIYIKPTLMYHDNSISVLGQCSGKNCHKYKF